MNMEKANTRRNRQSITTSNEVPLEGSVLNGKGDFILLEIASMGVKGLWLNLLFN